MLTTWHLSASISWNIFPSAWTCVACLWSCLIAAMSLSALADSMAVLQKTPGLHAHTQNTRTTFCLLNHVRSFYTMKHHRKSWKFTKIFQIQKALPNQLRTPVTTCASNTTRNNSHRSVKLEGSSPKKQDPNKAYSTGSKSVSLRGHCGISGESAFNSGVFHFAENNSLGADEHVLLKISRDVASSEKFCIAHFC